MVRYTEKTCLSHSVSGNVYDCEKFYATGPRRSISMAGHRLEL